MRGGRVQIRNKGGIRRRHKSKRETGLKTTTVTKTFLLCKYTMFGIMSLENISKKKETHAYKTLWNMCFMLGS